VQTLHLKKKRGSVNPFPPALQGGGERRKKERREEEQISTTKKRRRKDFIRVERGGGGWGGVGGGRGKGEKKSESSISSYRQGEKGFLCRLWKKGREEKKRVFLPNYAHTRKRVPFTPNKWKREARDSLFP